MLRSSLIILAVVWLSAFQFAQAGKFDCSVVYDEFDQLMMANFLSHPYRYVDTLNGKITRREFLNQQLGKFKLRKERTNAGIGTFKTNTNLHGKMIFFWQDNVWEERTPFVIDELIIFGRVEDGYAPIRSNAIYLTPGMGVDLDTSAVVAVDDETADIIYEQEGIEYFVQSVLPATVIFPVESMCSGKVESAEAIELEPEVAEQTTPNAE